MEQYHSVLLKYAPKREHFSYNGMVARTQLAVLDHNSNVHRQQAGGKALQCHLPKAKKQLGSQTNKGTKIL